MNNRSHGLTNNVVEHGRTNQQDQTKKWRKNINNIFMIDHTWPYYHQQYEGPCHAPCPAPSRQQSHGDWQQVPGTTAQDVGLPWKLKRRQKSWKLSLYFIDIHIHIYIYTWGTLCTGIVVPNVKRCLLRIWTGIVVLDVIYIMDVIWWYYIYIYMMIYYIYIRYIYHPVYNIIYDMWYYICVLWVSQLLYDNFIPFI